MSNAASGNGARIPLAKNSPIEKPAHEKTCGQFPGRRLTSCDGDHMPVICPTCQFFFAERVGWVEPSAKPISFAGRDGQVMLKLSSAISCAQEPFYSDWQGPSFRKRNYHRRKSPQIIAGQCYTARSSRSRFFSTPLGWLTACPRRLFAEVLHPRLLSQ